MSKKTIRTSSPIARAYAAAVNRFVREPLGWGKLDANQLRERSTRLLPQSPRRRPGARVTGALSKGE